MFDAKIRPIIDPPLETLARIIAVKGVRANTLTLFNLFLALTIIVLVAGGLFGLAFFAILLNRLIDGLDGPVARQHDIIEGREPKGTDFGGYFDIVTDFVLYGGVVFAFSLADAANGGAAAFLLFSYLVSGTSFLGYAVVAAKRDIETEQQGKKSFYYLSGLAEGLETIVVMCLMCLLPQFFIALASGFGVLCLISGGARIYYAYKSFA